MREKIAKFLYRLRLRKLSHAVSPSIYYHCVGMDMITKIASEYAKAAACITGVAEALNEYTTKEADVDETARGI